MHVDTYLERILQKSKVEPIWEGLGKDASSKSRCQQVTSERCSALVNFTMEHECMKAGTANLKPEFSARQVSAWV